MTAPRRTRIGRIPIDVIGFDDAVRAICDLSREKGGAIFTPNVDHIVRAENDDAFCAAYERAALSVVDGMPVLWASHLTPAPLREKISGADLFEPLMDLAAEENLSVYFLGGRKDAATISRDKLIARLPNLRVVGIGPRTKDILDEPSRLELVEQEIIEKKPNIVIVALGSPLQELWSDKVAERVKPAVLIGLGSVLDVYSGLIERAPLYLQRAGLEWAFRVAQEPKRLWRRYTFAAPRFLAIALQALGRGRISGREGDPK